MHVYFLGISGAGIGPLAQIADQVGYSVSGSDKQNSSYLEYLKSYGLSDISVSDSPEVIKQAHDKNPIDWLVFSSAVEMEESGQRQLEMAKSLNIMTSKRDQFIAEFVKDKNLKMIAIAGTHGKTTTTAMVAWLFFAINKPVSYLIPAKVSFGEMGSYAENSEYFIYEADEYDHNFLAFSPHLSLISGVSWDHHEIYPTRQEYIAAFREFISQSEQTLLWSSDKEYLQASGENLLSLDDNDSRLADIHLNGLYNRRDGWLAVKGLNQLLAVGEDQLIREINRFPGLSRRMEEIYPGLYSDYAHTPEKIRGAMSVASEIAKAKNMPLIVIYEPLTNRRQLYMLEQYKDSFKGAEHVYWLPSYLAREDPEERIIGPEELIAHLEDPSIAEPAERNDELIKKINGHLNQGQMVVAMVGGGGSSLDDWLREHFKKD